MERILLLDSDPKFSQVIRDGFERLGIHVDVVDDGHQALASAKMLAPDLILLSVELHNLNGWVVCKKIRTSSELKDIPLFVLSSEATEDIFEQHRRLSARADDYIHKPVSFEELLERVRHVLPLNEMVADDLSGAISVDSTGMYVEEVSQEAPGDEGAGVDSEIEEFAESAFGSLILNEQDNATSSARYMDQTDVNVIAPMGAMAEAMPLRSTEDEAEMALLREELSAAREEIQELMDTAKRRAAEADKLQHEAETLRKKATQEKSVAAVSGRELLDLRESLNRKDKEILDLRDQVTSRDRQLIEASDNALKAERELTDLREQIAALEKDLEAGREQNTGLVADKAKLSQRLGETRERAEAAEAQAQRGEEALAAANQAHENAMAEFKAMSAAEREALRKELEADAEQRMVESERAKQQALERASQEHEDAIVALRDKLQQKHDTEIRHQQSKHAEELALLGRRLANIESQLEETQESLRQAESDAGHMKEALSATIQTLEAQLEGLQKEHQATVGDLRAAREHIGSLQNDKAQDAARISAMEATQVDLQEKLEAAVNKMTVDEEFLQRARKAIAITATLLDEQKNNRLS
jgi:DNA-binding response OmpR family regulator/chromosome segregation ATPase